MKPGETIRKDTQWEYSGKTFHATYKIKRHLKSNIVPKGKSPNYASQRKDRKYVGVELNPKYTKLAAERIDGKGKIIKLAVNL